MRKSFLQYLFMLLVVVHLKDGTSLKFENADSYKVRQSIGNFGEKVLWLDVRNKSGKAWDAQIASFPWGEVKYVEIKPAL